MVPGLREPLNPPPVKKICSDACALPFVHRFEIHLGMVNIAFTPPKALPANPCTSPFPSEANVCFAALVLRPAVVVDIAIVSIAASQKLPTFWTETNPNQALTPSAVLCAHAYPLLWSHVRPFFPPITEAEVEISTHNLAKQNVVHAEFQMHSACLP